MRADMIQVAFRRLRQAWLDDCLAWDRDLQKRTACRLSSPHIGLIATFAPWKYCR